MRHHSDIHFDKYETPHVSINSYLNDDNSTNYSVRINGGDWTFGALTLYFRTFTQLEAFLFQLGVEVDEVRNRERVVEVQGAA